MPCSPARLLANQTNASRSTGPKTPAGKEASRRNALKHGLTGNGVVIPGEDQEEAAERVEALGAELAPQGGMMARILVKRVALMSIRAERCGRQESAMTAERVRTAADDFDEARRARADFLFDGISENPATHHRQLLAIPEGVDLLLGALRGLRSDVADFWTEEHAVRFDDCTGHRRGTLLVSRCQALTEAIFGDFDRIEPTLYAGLDLVASEEWAKDRLAELIDAEVARLEAHRATLSLEDLATSRAEAGERALFDAGPAATLARKYEANAERAMYKALKELKEIRIEAATPRSVVNESSGSPSSRPLGSFFQGAVAGHPQPELGVPLTYATSVRWLNAPPSEFESGPDRQISSISPPLDE